MGPGCQRLRIANMAGQEVLDQASPYPGFSLRTRIFGIVKQGLPERRHRAFRVRIPRLADDALNPVRVTRGKPESDGGAVVLHVYRKTIQTDRLGETEYYPVERLEGVLESIRGWKRRVPKARVVGAIR